MPPTSPPVTQSNVDKEIRRAAAAIIWQLWVMTLITWCLLFLLINVGYALVNKRSGDASEGLARLETLFRDRIKQEGGPYKLVHERIESEKIANTLQTRSDSGWKLIGFELTPLDPTTNRQVYDLIWSRQ